MKPRRLWVLQLVLLAQTVFALVRLARGLPALQSQPLRPDGLWWLLESVGILLCVVALLLALARWLPRSAVVAPLFGMLWWFHGIAVAARSLTSPPDPSIEPYLFKGVSRASEILGTIVVYALLLWLSGSLLWHSRTRAYLAGPPSSMTPSC